MTLPLASGRLLSHLVERVWVFNICGLTYQRLKQGLQYLKGLTNTADSFLNNCNLISLRYKYKRTWLCVFPVCLTAPTQDRVCKDSMKKIIWTYNRGEGRCVRRNGCYDLKAANVFQTEAKCKIGCNV